MPTPTDPLVPAPAAQPLAPDQLRLPCDPASIPPSGGEEPGGPLAGQDAVLEALALGLSLDGPSCHVFVCGPPGVGRTATVLELCEELAAAGPADAACDLAYVQDLDDPDRPRLLTFPPGEAVRFRDAMAEVVEVLRREVPRVLDEEGAVRAREAQVQRFERGQRGLLEGIDARARRAGLGLAGVVPGTVARPELLAQAGDDLIPLEEALARRRRGAGRPPGKLRKSHERLERDLDAAMGEIRRLARDVDQTLLAVDRNACRRAATGLLEDLKDRFPSQAAGTWVDEVLERVVARPDLFDAGEPPPPPPPPSGGEPEGEAPPADAGGGAWSRPGDDPFRALRVNVLLDRGGVDRQPVVVETVPTFANLLGTIERGPDDPAHLPLDFTGIRAGSLLRAHGGFIVLDAGEVLAEPGVWAGLRRVLKYGLLEIQPPPEGPPAPCSLRPEPIPLPVKVVLVGDAALYQELLEQDDWFLTVFKVKAEFDSEVEASPGGVTRYARFVEERVSREGLVPFDASAVAALVEAGMRDTERRGRLSTDFDFLADRVREAAFFAGRCRATVVEREHVHRALEARRRRHGLAGRIALEDITTGVVVIETSGTRVGQINALTVFDHGDHCYAVPCRVTGVVGAGRAGVISVEREAKLSGRIHSKSVLVLAGFLLERFGQRRPLALSASTVFEQSYDLLEGDSASSAETFVLLSALAGVPLDQGIAVTGAVTQKGELLAVGGINEKVEGFHDVCALRGLTGTQGVVVPRGNLDNLMLAPRVVEAVEAGRFHVWAVETVDEGLEVLSGVAAGERGDDGDFPAGTVSRRVADRLGALADAAVEELRRAH